MFEIKVQTGETLVAYTCSGEFDLLVAARRSGINIPVGCRGGGCGMCKILVLEGEYEQGVSSKAVLPDIERQQRYSLACKTYPRSNLHIRVTG